MANRESGGSTAGKAATCEATTRPRWSRRCAPPSPVQRPLTAIRPELTSRQRWTLSTSALSVMGSIVDHRAKLPAIQVRALLADLAEAVLAAEPPDPRHDEGVVEASTSRRSTESSRYEALLDESMQLFNLKGYRDTGMEDIATAVGMPVSGIYRYFSGKSDILAAAFRRAADRLSADTATITATIRRPGGCADRHDRRIRGTVLRPAGAGVRLLHRAAQHVRGIRRFCATCSAPPLRHGWRWWWRCGGSGHRDRRASRSTPRCHW